MQINFNPDNASYFLILQEVLKEYNLNDLTQDEITFLQLHFLEKLSLDQISELTGKDFIYIKTIKEKFTFESMI